MKKISVSLLAISIALVVIGSILVIIPGSAPTQEIHSRTISDGLIWPDSTWLRSSYAERGMDSLPILELIDSMSREKFAPINCLLIVKDGYLVTEEYFWGFDSSTTRSAQQITMSILSAVLGVAAERGELPDIHTPIATLLPNHRAIFKGDTTKNSITLEHLLTMTAGFQWDDSFQGYMMSDLDSLMLVDDPVGLVCARPLVSRPGEIFSFNDAYPVIASAILENAIGMPVKEYAARHLFEPIGASSVFWTSLNEITNGCTGISATPRDLARFGLLYARFGMWRGQRIIPLEWYMKSASGHTAIDTSSEIPVFYDYYWWATRSNDPELARFFPHGFLFAHGAGNQLIFVAPDHDLVVVMTAGQMGHETLEQTPLGKVIDYILPAVFPERYRQNLEYDEESGDNEPEGKEPQREQPEEYKLEDEQSISSI